MRLLAPPGVYRPLLDSRMLTSALRHAAPAAGARLLDLGTGSGVAAITGASLGARATAVDISRRAVAAARLNARLNGVRVRVVRGSLFTPVAGERFDCVVSNPPYVPSSSPSPPVRGMARAWDAGLDGRVLLDRIISQAPNHIADGGVLMLVHTAWVDEERTLELLRRAGFDAETVDRAHEPLGPVMRRRKAEGLLPAHCERDEIVVIGATAPGATRRAPDDEVGAAVRPTL